MKKLFLCSKYLISTLMVVSLLISCDKEIPVGAKNKNLNTDSLANILEGKLKNNCIGYAFIISYKSDQKSVRSGGEARRPQDPPIRKMSVLENYSTASVSKTITAAAFFTSIQDRRGITEDSLMWPYLPKHWRLGRGIREITFKELLTHTSGFRHSPVGLGNSYDSLKVLVAAGVNQVDKVSSYNNRNYSIFRLLIPAIEGNDIWEIPSATPSSQLPTLETAQALLYANCYIDYCRKNIFEKIGVTNAACDYESGSNPGLFYVFPANNLQGRKAIDNTLYSGGEGWVLSTASMSNFFRTLHYTEKILPAATANKMKKDLMGYDIKAKTKDGVSYYWKNGIYNYTNGAYRSLIIGFENDIQVAVMANSAINLQNTVIDAFEEWYK